MFIIHKKHLILNFFFCLLYLSQVFQILIKDFLIYSNFVFLMLEKLWVLVNIAYNLFNEYQYRPFSFFFFFFLKWTTFKVHKLIKLCTVNKFIVTVGYNCFWLNSSFECIQYCLLVNKFFYNHFVFLLIKKIIILWLTFVTLVLYLVNRCLYNFLVILSL